jgi:opacity protein-like surface antigen
MYRIKSAAAVALVLGVVFATASEAQPGGTLRVTSRAPIMETPRGDSFVLGTVNPGVVLEILDRRGNWYQVIAPPGLSRPRGWIHASSVELVGARPVAAKPPRPRMMIRGFGQAGGTLFSARDSFETILGRELGTVYGAGGQVVFPNGGFLQGSVERFRKTGSRVLVSGTQIFALQIPDTVTVMPVQVTAGFRDRKYHPAVPYVGVGLGWTTLKEESPSLTAAQEASDGHFSYHILGGAEFPLTSWLALAGEIQWTSVPKVLGNTGVSAVFKEDDLGGTAFRFKLILGY